MKQIKLSRIAILGVLIAFLVIASWIAYGTYKDTQIIYMDTYGIIGDHSGFDVSTSRVSFGMITPGYSALRTVDINNGAQPRIGQFYIQGNIAPMISISERIFELEPYENKTFTLLMSAPNDQPEGVYVGEFKIVLKGKR